VAEVKYRDITPINIDGSMAVFQSDVYSFSGVSPCNFLALTVFIVLEKQLVRLFLTLHNDHNDTNSKLFYAGYSILINTKANRPFYQSLILKYV
jgi:hypothetical protein